jgi:hypothetical protein
LVVGDVGERADEIGRIGILAERQRERHSVQCGLRVVIGV